MDFCSRDGRRGVGGYGTHQIYMSNGRIVCLRIVRAVRRSQDGESYWDDLLWGIIDTRFAGGTRVGYNLMRIMGCTFVFIHSTGCNSASLIYTMQVFE